MDLGIILDEHDGVPVLTLRGELDLATVPRLRDAFVRIANQHPGTVMVVDLDELSSLDDAGMGTLVGGLGRLRSHGGDIIVVCAGRLLEQLQLSRLDRVFSVYPTQTAARAAARAT
ncbi:MAG TPA: STAS domain-containing protein [Acidimicrobiales bacterium]